MVKPNAKTKRKIKDCRRKGDVEQSEVSPANNLFHSIFLSIHYSILYPHPHRSLLLIHFNSSGWCYIMLRRLCYIFLELSLYDACISIAAVVVDDYSSNKNETKTAILSSWFSFSLKCWRISLSGFVIICCLLTRLRIACIPSSTRFMLCGNDAWMHVTDDVNTVPFHSNDDAKKLKVNVDGTVEKPKRS